MYCFVLSQPQHISGDASHQSCSATMTSRKHSVPEVSSSISDRDISGVSSSKDEYSTETTRENVISSASGGRNAGLPFKEMLPSSEDTVSATFTLSNSRVIPTTVVATNSYEPNPSSGSLSTSEGSKLIESSKLTEVCHENTVSPTTNDDSNSMNCMRSACEDNTVINSSQTIDSEHSVTDYESRIINSAPIDRISKPFPVPTEHILMLDAEATNTISEKYIDSTESDSKPPDPDKNSSFPYKKAWSRSNTPDPNISRASDEEESSDMPSQKCSSSVLPDVEACGIRTTTAWPEVTTSLAMARLHETAGIPLTGVWVSLQIKLFSITLYC